MRYPVLVASLCSTCLAVPSLTAQGQEIVFQFGAQSSGITSQLTPSVFSLRAGSALGSHAVSVPLGGGAGLSQLANALVPAAAAQQLTVAPVVVQGQVVNLRLAAVDGTVPTRGCLIGTDDTAIQTLRAELAGEGSSRFLGCAIAKANATSPLAGAFQLQLFGKRTTDGQLFNLLLQVPIVAGEPAVALNQRIRTNLEAAGCTVFDIAIPSFSNPAVTAAGFGIDRYGISTGAFAGSYRVFGVVSLYSAATRAIPKVVGVGWFPTGGFAEYGRGHAASGLEPYARAEGGFAPGDSHDVVLEFGRATLGLCLVAAERAALPLGNGALLLVDPATLVDVVPCHAGPSGSWRRSVAIPPTAAVLGRTLHYQGHGINSTGWVATSGLYSRVWQ